MNHEKEPIHGSKSCALGTQGTSKMNGSPHKNKAIVGSNRHKIISVEEEEGQLDPRASHEPMEEDLNIQPQNTQKYPI